MEKARYEFLIIIINYYNDGKLEIMSTLSCNFGGRSMSGFEVIEGVLRASPPVAGSKYVPNTYR